MNESKRNKKNFILHKSETMNEDLKYSQTIKNNK